MIDMSIYVIYAGGAGDMSPPLSEEIWLFVYRLKNMVDVFLPL